MTTRRDPDSIVTYHSLIHRSLEGIKERISRKSYRRIQRREKRRLTRQHQAASRDMMKERRKQESRL
jgi:hypothetical protein